MAYSEGFFSGLIFPANLAHAALVTGHPGHGVPLTLPYSLAATSAILAPNPIV